MLLTDAPHRFQERASYPFPCRHCGRWLSDPVHADDTPTLQDIKTESTPDGAPRVWLLYQPEPYPHGGHEDRAIHLWVRRCSVFTSMQAAILHLDNLLGHQVPWRKYDPLFPELWIGEDHRGYRWLMEPAPVGGFE